jgi:hypothetical protein
MKILLKLVFVGLFAAGAVYLVLPSPGFPPPPPGSLVSNEPADTETIYRQAYYSNLSRSEVMKYYTTVFRSPLQFTLNHPPEDAGTLIRDQTRSSYLEEIVHPGKEVLYVNGYTPTKPEDKIVRNGLVYSSKIVIHLIPSTIITRLTVLLLTAVVTVLLWREYRHV